MDILFFPKYSVFPKYQCFGGEIKTMYFEIPLWNILISKNLRFTKHTELFSSKVDLNDALQIIF